MSSIEWTDATWNPTVGCSRVSPGCENCYAERVAHRGLAPQHRGLTVMGKHGPRWTGEVRLVPERLAEPLHWRKPRRVFVDSMSDLFHEGVPFEFVAAVFGVMAATPHHTYQVLTKRPERMREFFRWLDEPPGPRNTVVGPEGDVLARPRPRLVVDHVKRVCGEATWQTCIDGLAETETSWPLPNVWLGCSLEDQQRADERIPMLLQCPAAVRFLSVEPMLGPVDLLRVQWPEKHRVDVLRGGLWDGHLGFVNHSDFPATIDWVIVGGESGPGARPFDVSWAWSILAQCREAGVAAFCKQLGSRPVFYPGDDVTGYEGIPQPLDLLDRKGGDMEEWPAGLRVRQFPEVRP